MKETLFESILKENNPIDDDIKDYEDVEVGDIGEDYSGNKVRIIAKGTIGELLDYDSTGAAKDYINECDDGELYNVSSYDGVAVEDLYHKDPRYPSFVYEYGPSGIVVYEKIKNFWTF